MKEKKCFYLFWRQSIYKLFYLRKVGWRLNEVWGRLGRAVRLPFQCLVDRLLSRRAELGAWGVGVLLPPTNGDGDKSPESEPSPESNLFPGGWTFSWTFLQENRSHRTCCMGLCSNLGRQLLSEALPHHLTRQICSIMLTFTSHPPHEIHVQSRLENKLVPTSVRAKVLEGK